MHRRINCQSWRAQNMSCPRTFEQAVQSHCAASHSTGLVTPSVTYIAQGNEMYTNDNCLPIILLREVRVTSYGRMQRTYNLVLFVRSENSVVRHGIGLLGP